MAKSPGGPEGWDGWEQDTRIWKNEDVRVGCTADLSLGLISPSQREEAPRWNFLWLSSSSWRSYSDDPLGTLKRQVSEHASCARPATPSYRPSATRWQQGTPAKALQPHPKPNILEVI
jgi:hypothetical protein